jgi:hypothetical protein
MIASSHSIRYRTRAISPPTPQPAGVARLRSWRPLSIGGDFASGRQHASRWSPEPTAQAQLPPLAVLSTISRLWQTSFSDAAVTGTPITRGPA